MFAEAPRLLPEPGSEPGADRKPRPGLPGPERGARTGSGTGTGTREPPPRPFPWRPPAPRRGAQEELPHAGLAQVAPPAWSSKPSAWSLEPRHVRGPRPRGRTASGEPDADEHAVQRRLPRRRDRLGAQRGRARGKGLPDRTALGTDGLSVSRRRLHRGSLHFVFVPFCVEYVLPYLWRSS